MKQSQSLQVTQKYNRRKRKLDEREDHAGTLRKSRIEPALRCTRNQTSADTLGEAQIALMYFVFFRWQEGWGFPTTLCCATGKPKVHLQNTASSVSRGVSCREALTATVKRTKV